MVFRGQNPSGPATGPAPCTQLRRCGAASAKEVLAVVKGNPERFDNGLEDDFPKLLVSCGRACCVPLRRVGLAAPPCGPFPACGAAAYPASRPAWLRGPATPSLLPPASPRTTA